jgi:hypothetical protein
VSIADGAVGGFFLNVDGTSGGDDLGHLTSTTTYALDRDADNIPPKGKYLMWKSINDSGEMRVLLSNVLYYTDDSWSTMTTGSSMSWSPVVLAWAGDQAGDDDYKRVIVCQGITAGLAIDAKNEEHVFVTDDNGTTQEDKSGANVDSAPYTDSIPGNAGGICAAVILDRDYYH